MGSPKYFRSSAFLGYIPSYIDLSLIQDKDVVSIGIGDVRRKITRPVESTIPCMLSCYSLTNNNTAGFEVPIGYLGR